MDLVSVIIPYFRKKDTILESINSILKQTYKNFEIIIVYDDENKSDLNYIKEFKNIDNRISVIQNKENKGAGESRNIGIVNSKGKFIAFLDSDDYWKKNKLKIQLKKLNKTKADILFTAFKAINEKKKVLYSVKPPIVITYKNLIRSCPVCCSSVLIKKKCLNKIRFLNYRTKEDYDLWLRLSKKGFKIISINNFLTFYTVRSSTLSSLHLNKVQNAYYIYSNSLKFGFFYSLFAVLRLYFNAFKKKYLANE